MSLPDDEPHLTRPVQPHHLCNNCVSFWGRATCLNFSFDELSASRGDIPAMPQHLLHSNCNEIRTAAQSGCHFCSILLGSLEGCTGTHEALEPHELDAPIYSSIATLDPEEGSFLMTLFSCEQAEILSHDQVRSRHSLRIRPSNSKAHSAHASIADLLAS
jgi:hypothetical protein